MATQRDTDADWRELGAAQPYWGVLTQSEYRTENLTPERIEAFYASGVRYIDDIVGMLKRATGAAPGGRALDFGCGTGRLADAMSAYAQTTGYDIAPGMLAKARERGGKATYVDQLPDGPFDWINSFIVFQHIPPARGLKLIEDLMARLAPGGHVSLQVTVWRERHLEVPVLKGWRRVVLPLLGRTPPPPTGVVSMYDYDLGAVLRLLNLAGVEEMSLISTNHGGHHGVIVLGRRTVAAQRVAA
jgi:SAM-dependent methyltransferase